MPVRADRPPRAFVFVDRDGTLVEDRGYLHRVDDYRRLPGAAEGLRRLAERGFGVAIVTNQSGIARGYFGEQDFQRFQAHLLADFEAQGVHIEASYFCPHLPDAGCGCRKPRPGLIERAARELSIDLAASWVIGDKPSDVELARNVGCCAIYLSTRVDEKLPAGVLRARDLLEAAQLIARSAASR